MTMRVAAGLALLLASSTVAPPAAVAQSPETDGVPAQIQDGWRTASPADVGLDPARLAELTRSLRRDEHGNVHGVLIEKDGRLVYEEYFTGEDETWGSSLGTVTFGRASLHDLRSVSKTVVSTLVGIAIGRGEIRSAEARLRDLLPEYAALLEGGKAELRLRHVLSMSAGLEWDEWSQPYSHPQNDWQQLTRAADPVAFLLDRELVHEPGGTFTYNGGLTHLLAVILERATGEQFDDYARRVLFDPLGIRDVVWLGRIGGIPSADAGLRLRARDLARIGSLFLNGGRWNGTQIVPEAWVAEAPIRRVTAPPLEPVPDFGLEVGYGYQWWSTRYATSHGEVDVYIMLGNGQQRVMVVPELSLAVTMFAGHYNDPSAEIGWMPDRLLVEYIIDAMRGDAVARDDNRPELAPAAPAWPPPGLGAFIAVDEMGPVVPVRAEGGHHLSYELRLTSFDPRLLELDSLEVLDGDLPSRVLARYGGTELIEMIETRSPSATDDPTRLHPGSHGVVYLWLELNPGEIPRRLRHRLLLRHGTGADRQTHRLTTDPVRVSDEPPLVIAPPLRGGPWYAQAGPANASHHRRLLAPRDGTLTNDTRFASDWLLLEQDVTGSGDLPFVGPDWSRTSGSDVFSVADGRVVEVVDGLPDDPISRSPRPDEVIDWHTIGGNRITVALGDGRYAWYGHLRPGSLTVQPGDSVRRGQLLAVVGNSGNSAAPHLHFDIIDSEVTGKGEGLPFVFECFDLVARAENMPGWDALLDAAEGGRPPWDRPLRPHAVADRRRINETPLGGAIVVFPDACGGPGEESSR